jgi:hypothetical protein
MRGLDRLLDFVKYAQMMWLLAGDIPILLKIIMDEYFFHDDIY